jgi:GcrA cell cycle regulator
MDWSEPEINTLKTRWADGYSASMIGNELGCTRNAVIGKVFRLGLSDSGHKPTIVLPHPPRVKQRGPAKLKPKPAPSQFPYIERRRLAPTHPVKFSELLPWHCHYMLGEPSDDLYCGAAVKAGSPYCATHHKLAHAKPE